MRASVIGSVLVLVLVGCGRIAEVPDDTAPANDAGTSPGTSGSVTSPASDAAALRDAAVADAHTTRSAGRCAKDADCAAGGHCVELAPGGYRVCSYSPPAPEACTNDPSHPDECCVTCAGGTCTLQTACGGPFIMAHNVCAISECTANADCGPGGICLPTGVGSPYARTCMSAPRECLKHSDCDAAPDGVCALVGFVGPLSQCAPWGCPGMPTGPANGLACIYGSECAGDEDCAMSGEHCELTGGRPTCRPGERIICAPPP